MINEKHASFTRQGSGDLVVVSILLRQSKEKKKI